MVLLDCAPFERLGKVTAYVVAAAGPVRRRVDQFGLGVAKEGPGGLGVLLLRIHLDRYVGHIAPYREGALVVCGGIAAVMAGEADARPAVRCLDRCRHMLADDVGTTTTGVVFKLCVGVVVQTVDLAGAEEGNGIARNRRIAVTGVAGAACHEGATRGVMVMAVHAAGRWVISGGNPFLPVLGGTMADLAEAAVVAGVDQPGVDIVYGD